MARKLPNARAVLGFTLESIAPVHDWAAWKRTNADKITHVAGFEEIFVDTVLSKISSLSPEDVVAQYEFDCDKRKRRRIDFMIINPQKGYLLPIELDGKNKSNVEDWSDFLQRQNSLVMRFRTTILLRYSNALMFANPGEIIRQISSELLSQTAAFDKQDDINRDISKELLTRIAALDKQDRAIKDIAQGLSTHKTVLDQQGEMIRQIANELLTSKTAKRFDDERHLDISGPVKSGKSTRPQLMTSGAALFAAIILVYFILRNNAPHDADFQRRPTATVSNDLNGTTQPPVIVPYAIVPQRPNAASPPIDTTPSHTISLPGSFILASQAKAYIGQNKKVCGQIAGLKETSSGLFINFDRPYPSNVMAAVIWREHLNQFDRSQLSENRRLCISGTIYAYHGKPQIEIDSSEQIIQK